MFSVKGWRISGRKSPEATKNIWQDTPHLDALVLPCLVQEDFALENGFVVEEGTAVVTLNRAASVSEEFFTRGKEFIPERYCRKRFTVETASGVGPYCGGGQYLNLTNDPGRELLLRTDCRLVLALESWCVAHLNRAATTEHQCPRLRNGLSRWIDAEREEALLGKEGTQDGKDVVNHETEALLAFGAGPRMCPGQV